MGRRGRTSRGGRQPPARASEPELESAVPTIVSEPAEEPAPEAEPDTVRPKKPAKYSSETRLSWWVSFAGPVLVTVRETELRERESVVGYYFREKFGA